MSPLGKGASQELEHCLAGNKIKLELLQESKLLPAKHNIKFLNELCGLSCDVLSSVGSQMHNEGSSESARRTWPAGHWKSPQGLESAAAVVRLPVVVTGVVVVWLTTEGLLVVALVLGSVPTIEVRPKSHWTLFMHIQSTHAS